MSNSILSRRISSSRRDSCSSMVTVVLTGTRRGVYSDSTYSQCRQPLLLVSRFDFTGVYAVRRLRRRTMSNGRFRAIPPVHELLETPEARALAERTSRAYARDRLRA